MPTYVGAPYKVAYTLDGLNPITNNSKMQMRQWPSIGEAIVVIIKPSMELEPNLVLSILAVPI